MSMVINDCKFLARNDIIHIESSYPNADKTF